MMNSITTLVRKLPIGSLMKMSPIGHILKLASDDDADETVDDIYSKHREREGECQVRDSCRLVTVTRC